MLLSAHFPFCQDKTFTIYIDSQPAYPPGGVPEAYSYVDVKLTAEVKDARGGS
jgi:hypothetical protein